MKMNNTDHAMTWMNFENTVKWKKPVTKEYILPDSIYTWNLLNSQIYRDRKYIIIAIRRGVKDTRKMRGNHVYRVLFWITESVLKLIVAIAIQFSRYNENHWIVPFKLTYYVNYISIKLLKTSINTICYVNRQKIKIISIVIISI